MIGALITLLVVIVLIAVLYFLGYISFGKLAKGDYCVPETFKANATEYKIDDESNCVVSNCATGFTLSGGVCVAVTPAIVEKSPCYPEISSYVDGGKNYQQIKKSDGTFECKPTACSSDFYAYSNNNCTPKGELKEADKSGDKCYPESASDYYLYGDGYTLNDSLACTLSNCAPGSKLINEKCMIECAGFVPTNITPVDNAIYYRLPGKDEDDSNCTPLACESTFTATTGTGGVVTACTSTTGTYTPRRSGYSMRYNSKKLEGMKL